MRPVELQHDPPHGRIDGVKVGRERLGQFDFDLADMVCSDRHVGAGGQITGIDGMVDGADDAAALRGADADDDRAPIASGVSMQPEHTGAHILAGQGGRRAASDKTWPRVDEQLAVERDADRLSRACACGGGRARPAPAMPRST